MWLSNTGLLFSFLDFLSKRLSPFLCANRRIDTTNEVRKTENSVQGEGVHSLKEYEARYKYHWLTLIDNRYLLNNDAKVVHIGIIPRSRLIEADYHFLSTTWVIVNIDTYNLKFKQINMTTNENFLEVEEALKVVIHGDFLMLTVFSFLKLNTGLKNE